MVNWSRQVGLSMTLVTSMLVATAVAQPNLLDDPAPVAPDLTLDADVLGPVLPPPEMEGQLDIPLDGSTMSGDRPPPVAEDDPLDGGGNLAADSLLSATRGGTSLDGETELVRYPPSRIRHSGTQLWRGHWYTEQEFIVLVKNPGNRIQYSFDSSNGDTLAASALRFTFEPGLRFTLGNNIGRDEKNRDHSIEMTFFGLFDWEESAFQRGGDSGSLDSLFSNFERFGTGTIVGFDNADTHSLLYRADLNSLELNLRIRSRLGRDAMAMQPDGSWVREMVGGRVFSIMGGMRLMSINEHFVFDSVTPTDLARTTLDTHNDMFGLQGGVSIIDQYASWSWGATAIGGGMYNFAQRRVRADTLIGGVTGFDEIDQTGKGLVLLLGLRLFGKVQLHPHMALQAGYELLHLGGGLAMAPENVATGPDFGTLNVSGEGMYHGVHTGMEVVW